MIFNNKWTYLLLESPLNIYLLQIRNCVTHLSSKIRLSPVESGFNTLSLKHFHQSQSVDSWPRFNILQRFPSPVCDSLQLILPPAPMFFSLSENWTCDIYSHALILLYQCVQSEPPVFLLQLHLALLPFLWNSYVWVCVCVCVSDVGMFCLSWVILFT